MDGYNKCKVVWTKNGTEEITLENIKNISTTENFEPKNNKASIKLLDDDNLYTDNVFLPQEGDIFVIYAKTVVNAGDTEFVDNDIIWTGKYVDNNRDTTADNELQSLEIVDFAYDLFNRLWAKSYKNEGLKTNEVLIDIIENASENRDGSGTYTIDTTNIASTRNDSSAFPVIEPIFINKPVYEWVSELCSPSWTNSDAEYQTTNQVIYDTMIFRIKGNMAYWYEPTLSSITIDDSYTIISIKSGTTNEESVNRLILECGEDFNGYPIHWYIYDEQSIGSVTKEQYKNVMKLAGKNSDYDNEYHSLRKEYNLGTNSEFIDRVVLLASSYSEFWFKEFGRSRNKVTITIPRINIEIGSIINLAVSKHKQGVFQVKSVSHSISEKEWTTTLELIQKIDE